MRIYRGRVGWAAVLLLLSALPATAENTDPANDDSQWAWSENAGWLNAESSGNGGPGVQVVDGGLTGYLWSENAGWVSLSCQNTGSCGTQSYGVTNNGCGVLAGYAWAENAGWISFSCTNTGNCGSVSYGVTINPASGDFSGFAWSENLGWIAFAATSPTPFKVRTSWTAPSLAGSSRLTLAKGAGTVNLQWTPLPGSATYQVVHGSLGNLRASGGDFSVAVNVCDPGIPTNSTSYPLGASTEFYLVRGTGCGTKGTMNEPGGNQVGSRDAEIAASGHDCP